VAQDHESTGTDPTPRRALPWGPIVGGILVAAGIGWAYESSFRILFDRWSRDDNYSFGWFVVPIAIAILWERRDRIAGTPFDPMWWSIVPLVALLALRYPLYEANEQWVEMVTIPFAVAGCLLALAGWRWLWWATPAILFLFLMIPFPSRFNNLLADPLQTIATIGSLNVLQVMALPVISEGNVIIVGSERLEVARACNGLSMLLSFTTLITAMVILIRRPIWERIVLFLSIVPIALICNILRIVTTAVVYHVTGREVEAVHDYAGYAMMPLALIFVLLELRLMSWLVTEVDIEGQRPSVIRTGYGPSQATAS
jgi:exosortase